MGRSRPITELKIWAETLLGAYYDPPDPYLTLLESYFFIDFFEKKFFLGGLWVITHKGEGIGLDFSNTFSGFSDLVGSCLVDLANLARLVFWCNYLVLLVLLADLVLLAGLVDLALLASLVLFQTRF